jgi:hypothetical protein
MSDVFHNWRTARILAEAATFRTLHQHDPSIGPATVATLREIFRVHRDDAGELHRIETEAKISVSH